MKFELNKSLRWNQKSEEHKMGERFKRYITGYIVIVFVLIIAHLTDCASDTYMDSAGTVKNIEHDEVTGEYDADAALEPEAIDDSESSDINNDTNLDSTDIYENFLNGELTVEKKEEQLYISELFWDNDIEYCFGDIDGDGSEELHIRDSVVYYMIKVCDGTPQIFFEGWWSYEPVVTDGQCGILYYDHGYGSEIVEFIRISTDGSRENDGEFRWFDGNKDGKMDEEDSFRGLIGYEDIDMEQYVQYREKQIARQEENELEWTERQLKSFATWQEAYADFIQKLHGTISEYGEMDYSLIYVDDNDIPELFIYTGGMATGEFIVSFYDGNIGVMNRERCGTQYIEYGGLLYNMNGNMGFSPCNIYMLKNGKFSEIGTGWCSEHCDENENWYWDYFWEDSPVTEAEYIAHINELIDTSKCVEPSTLYSKDEILEILR